MHAGRLRDWVTIRRQINTKNPQTGGLERSWSTVAADLPAEVVSVNGREAMIAGVLQGVSTFRITIRRRTDIRMSDQALWSGRELNIHSAEDLGGRRQWTVIVASTLAPQGA